MDYFKFLIYVFAVVIVILMCKKMKFIHILLCVFSGIFALISCDIILSLYGGNMPINAYTLTFGAVGGIPSVILLLLLKTFII